MLNIVFTRNDFIRRANLYRQQVANAEQRRNADVGTEDAERKEDDRMKLIERTNIAVPSIMTPIIEQLKEAKSVDQVDSAQNQQITQQKTQPTHETQPTHQLQRQQTDPNNSCSNINDSYGCAKISQLLFDTFAKLRECWDSLSTDWKHSIKTAAIGAGTGFLISLIRCFVEGKSPQESIKIILRDTTVSGFGAGFIRWITEKTVEHWDAIKLVLFGVNSEITEATAKQYCGAIIGPLVVTFIDCFYWFGAGIYSGKFSHMLWSEILQQFGNLILDSLTIGFSTAFASVQIANAMPWFLTLVVMLVIASLVSNLKQKVC